jgi:hypothetical protein
MKNKLPERLPAGIQKAVAPVFESACEAGWEVALTFWESRNTVEISAKSPSGATIYAVCSPSELPERLRVLLDL